jgi:hypothetical protein
MSTDLSPLAASVTSGIERLGQRNELRDQLRSMDAVGKTIDGLLLQLHVLGEVVAAARQAGFAPTMPDVAEATAALRKLAAQLAAVDVDREFAQKVIDKVRAALATADEALTAAWREYVSSRVPGREGLIDLAQAFRDVEGASNDARDLEAAAASVQTLLQRRPSVEAVRRLGELANAIPALLQRLVGAEETVGVFADQLARGGASIEALTPAVLGWMQDKGFMTSFKIVPGRPAADEPA